MSIFTRKKKVEPAPEPVAPRPKPVMPTFPTGYVFTVRKATEGDYRTDSYGRRAAYIADVTNPQGTRIVTIPMIEKDPYFNHIVRELSEAAVIQFAIEAKHTLNKILYRQECEAKYLGDYPPKTIPLTKEAAK